MDQGIFMGKMFLGIFLCLVVAVVFAYQLLGADETKIKINQAQFDRCMQKGRSISDTEAIKFCQNRQSSKTQ